MGRPRICDESRVLTAIRLPASLRNGLESAAFERDVSLNFLVTRAVEEYLSRLPPLDPEAPGRGGSWARAKPAETASL